ncbi:L-threonylcarbamoyladenylate synthase [Gaopeijia maritima]|uniref:L-threonylcarbamoyladenylate synthase n=1 Tax=Gaopeijia maritima TaxID=3119007 RepID=UPI0032539CB4
MKRIDVRGLEGAALSEALAPVVDHLAGGGLIGYPTATVYGFGGAASSSAVERLARLKGRDPDRPFLLLVPDRDPLEALEWTPSARALAAGFWPGPLTLVLGDRAGVLPAAVRSRQGGVAVRRSGHPVVRALLARAGHPITSTSANPPGAAPAIDADGCEAAWRAFGDGGEGLVIDAGPLPPSAASTIVDCLGEVPVVLREGAISVDELRRVVPELLSTAPHP